MGSGKKNEITYPQKEYTCSCPICTYWQLLLKPAAINHLNGEGYEKLFQLLQSFLVRSCLGSIPRQSTGDMCLFVHIFTTTLRRNVGKA